LMLARSRGRLHGLQTTLGIQRTGDGHQQIVLLVDVFNFQIL
jgi:hypothetical protein